MERVRPCEGVCHRHVLEDQTLDAECVKSFGSVVRTAHRAREGNPDMLVDFDRWPSESVKGYLTGPNGGVSGVLSLRGYVDVFWSSRCRGVATNVDGSLGVARCADCKDFYRRGVTKRVIQASRHTPDKCTRNDELSTAQKVRRAAVRELAEGQCRGCHVDFLNVIDSLAFFMVQLLCVSWSAKQLKHICIFVFTSLPARWSIVRLSTAGEEDSSLDSGQQE